MPSKPKLLVLSHFLPFPPHGGAAIRTYNLLKGLAESFDITLVAVSRFAHQATQFDVDCAVAGCGAIAKRVCVIREDRPTVRRQVSAHLLSLVSLRPYTDFQSPFSSLRATVKKLMAEEHFDLFHVDAIDLAPLLALLPPDRTVLNHHNVESELLQRRAAIKGGAIRLLITLQSKLVDRQERTVVPAVALNVAVSKRDAVHFDSLGSAIPTVVAPNGADTDYFQPSTHEVTGREVVFVGGLSWFPNRDALEFYCDEILPFIKKRHPDLITTWVGKATDEDLRNPRFLGVTLTGYVEDVREYVARARCILVPLRVGGGTRLKILEAWAQGKAVVSTTVGCEGLAAENGSNIAIADSALAFANAVEAMLADESPHAAIGAAARTTVESQYSWRMISKDLARAYNALANRYR